MSCVFVFGSDYANKCDANMKKKNQLDFNDLGFDLLRIKVYPW